MWQIRTHGIGNQSVFNFLFFLCFIATERLFWKSFIGIAVFARIKIVLKASSVECATYVKALLLGKDLE